MKGTYKRILSVLLVLAMLAAFLPIVGVFLLFQLIAYIIMDVIRKKKRKKRNAVVSLAWHSVNTAIFAILELAMWYFVPVLTIAKFIPGFLVFLTIGLYYLTGYLENKKNLKAFIILIIALALYEILDSMLIGEFRTWKALIMLIVYALILLAGYIFIWKAEGSAEGAGIRG